MTRSNIVALIAFAGLGCLTGCGGGGQVETSTPMASAPPPAAAAAPVAAAPADTTASAEGDGYTPPDDSGSSDGSMPVDNYEPPMDDTAMGSSGDTYDPYAGQGMGYPGGDMAAGYDPNYGTDGYGMAGSYPGAGGIGAPAPVVDPVPDEDASLIDKAKYAFGIGKEANAIDYVSAYALAEEGGVEILQKTKWSSVALRPTTVLRFGVGVVLEAPTSLKDLKPIGSKQRQGGGGDGGYTSDGSGQPAAAAASTSKERAFYEMTGTFGNAVVESFKSRWASGELGNVLNEVAKIEPKKPGPANNMPAGYAMGMSGDSGSAGDGYNPDETTNYGGEATGATTENKPLPRVLPGEAITPGLTFIGSAPTQNELLSKAEEFHLDVILVFDVTVTGPNRMGLVTNEARLRLLAPNHEILAKSSEVINTKVELAQMRNADDEMQKTIDKFFAQFDSRVKLESLPAIKPEQAKARIVKLLADKNVSNLQKLYETKLYESLGLLTPEDKLTAFLIVLNGSEGESLANGTVADKLAVLTPMLPEYK